MWTPKRILIMLGGLALFLAGYAVYAFFLGGIDGLPVLPEIYWPTPGPLDPYNLGKRLPEGETETKMKLAFGYDSPESKWSIKLDLRSKGLLLAAKEFDIEGGRVKLTPFSAALFGKNKGDGFPEINTVQCEKAWLTLDSEVNSMADLTNRKIVGVELSGYSGVRISNNRRTAEKTDDIDLYVTGAPLYYDEPKNLIWTEGFVQLLDNKTQPHPTKITAKGMEIKLSEDSGPNRSKSVSKTKEKDDSIGGVEMIYLKSDVDMHLYVDASSGFLAGTEDAGKARTAANTGALPEKSHVVVRTLGPFHYDLTKELAWFDSPPAGTAGALDQVLVLREHKVGDIRKNDQLLCEHLELQFRKKADVDPRAPRDPQSPDKDIDTALATARTMELVLTMDTEDLVAYGEELYYRSPIASIGPQTILKGSSMFPMRAAKDGHKIKARELHLIGADKFGNGQQAFAKGPGQIDLYDKKNPDKAIPSRAVWGDSLITVKERDGDKFVDVLTMTGDASFVDEENKRSLKGQKLQVWLESDRPAQPGIQRAVNATSASGQKVRRIEAFENVTLRTPQSIIHHTNHLTIPIKNAPTPGTQLPDVLPPVSEQPVRPPPPGSGPLARLEPPQLGSPVPEPKSLVQAPTKSRKPIEVWANEVTVYLTAVGDNQELQALDALGAVHVYQEGEESQDKKSKEKGVDITGEMLSLVHHPRGDTLYVFGDSRKPAKPARLQLGELLIIGPKVTINQKDNVAEVQGVGVMSMPSNTSFEGGKTSNGKTRLTVHWNQDMIFTGKYADFHGGVQAFQDNALLKCRDLAVTLDRVVSFKEGQKENQSAQVEKLLCDYQVWVLDEKKDPGGKRIGFDRLVATQLTADNQDGPINAAGPGKFEHLAQGSSDVFDAPGRRSRDDSVKETQVMKLTRVLFDGRMFSNNKDNTRTAKFYDNVQVFHFPTEDEDARMDPDHPPKDGFYMKCKILNVFTRQIDNKTSQLMRADGNVFFRTQEFFGTAAVVKYDESQEQVIFEGTPGNPAALYRKVPGKADPQEIKGGKILYNRKTGFYHLDGVKVITGWLQETMDLRLQTVDCRVGSEILNLQSSVANPQSSLHGWTRIARISRSLPLV